MTAMANHEPAADNRRLRRQQVLTVVAMYAGYAMFMVLRMGAPAVGTAIQSDLEIKVETWGRIIALGGVGAMCGKLICGYLADKLGGKITFTLGLLVTAAAMGLFACSSSVLAFQATLFLALLAKSAGWPAMTKIITNWFRPDQYGRVWGVISTSSRVGTIAATLGLGGLLAWLSWREALLLASGLALLFVLYCALRLKEAPEGDLAAAEPNVHPDAEPLTAPHALDGSTLPAALGVFFTSRQFWLITGSLAGLTILWDFLQFVPLFLKDAVSLADAQASMASSAFPVGSLISVLAGGVVFDKLSRRKTAFVMLVLLIVAVGCLLGLQLLPALAASAGQDAAVYAALALLFVFGLCVSPCYYIPMSVFSIEFGGPHSGFLIALLDAIAFGVTSVFYYFGGALGDQSWNLFLGVLAGIAAWSTVTTFVFMLGEARRQRPISHS